MSIVTETIPEWDKADRMAKSLRHAGLSITNMAEYFDVHRNTVSGWLHGRIQPDTRTLRLWALRTGVPYEWLRYGSEPFPPDPLTQRYAGFCAKSQVIRMRSVSPATELLHSANKQVA